MKKYMFIIMLLLLLTILTACSGKKPDTKDESTGVVETEETTSTHTLAEYFPYQEDTLMIYAGEGNEYASYQSYTDYISDNRMQTRTNNGGSEIVRVYELNDGKLTLLLSKGECYYREDFTKADYTSGEILIQEPLEIGTKWQLTDDATRYISGIDVSVETTLGTYQTIEVTTDYAASKIIDYYAPGVGLVKTISTSNEATDSPVTSTLQTITKGTALKQNINFYYPDADLNNMYYISKEVSFFTNDITRLVFADVYKQLPSTNTVSVLTEGALIQSLYLNKEGIACIDMSDTFVSEMNAGSGVEALILECLTSTIGVYYGVEKVNLTVDNLPYSSGHILMKTGEYFTVDTLDAKPLP